MSSLDEQQRVVFDKALAGQSLFVTGGAGQYDVICLFSCFEIILGSGKSFLMRVIIEALRQKFGHAFMVAVTASTGMASSRIGGMSFYPRQSPT